MPDSAAAARARIKEVLHAHFRRWEQDRHDDMAMADVLLVTSELAANAVRHGGGMTDFRAELTPEGLRLSIADRSDDEPHVINRPEGQFTVGGYGWPLVCRLAEDIVITPLPGGGKRIGVLLPLS